MKVRLSQEYAARQAKKGKKRKRDTATEPISIKKPRKGEFSLLTVFLITIFYNNYCRD